MENCNEVFRCAAALHGAACFNVLPAHVWPKGAVAAVILITQARRAFHERKQRSEKEGTDRLPQAHRLGVCRGLDLSEPP